MENTRIVFKMSQVATELFQKDVGYFRFILPLASGSYENSRIFEWKRCMQRVVSLDRYLVAGKYSYR